MIPVRSAPSDPDFASVLKFRRELEDLPAVPIEEAARLLKKSVRTLYRRRANFEYKRVKRHLYFTLRSIREQIELEYNPTAVYDLTRDGTSGVVPAERTK